MVEFWCCRAESGHHRACVCCDGHSTALHLQFFLGHRFPLYFCLLSVVQFVWPCLLSLLRPEQQAERSEVVALGRSQIFH